MFIRLALFAWLICSGSALATDKPVAEFVQVHPAVKKGENRARAKDTAVVLIHGTNVCFSKEKADRIRFHSWQLADSPMVDALSANADVYSFAYCQKGTLDEVAGNCGLKEHVAELERLGYERIVLVGHSAGGLIARHFVEDHPDSGVTKVVQVCAPNAGTCAALMSSTTANEKFIASLTPQSRRDACKARAEKPIPKKVEFVCVIGSPSFRFDPRVNREEIGVEIAVGGNACQGDGVVDVESQWSLDLRKQGIPATLLRTTHFSVMRSKTQAAEIAKIIDQDHRRWNDEDVKKYAEQLSLKKDR